MSKILITGGSGLVGLHLSQLLQQNHTIVHLSRSPSNGSAFKTYHWDVEAGSMDETALEGLDYIIHLAGANVAEKRWTEQRKQEIIDSRVESARLLRKHVAATGINLKGFISASAVGYYGMDTGERWVDEQSPKGAGFLADVVELWEREADTFQALAPVTKIRIGVVLSKEGGALKAMYQPMKYGFGASLGDGQQYMSWIHIDDLCRIFEWTIDHSLDGVFNGVAPNPVTNETFTEIMAEVADKPLFLPKVPGFTMKLVLGEMAQVVLGGNQVSSGKIQDTGFEFKYASAEQAIHNLL